MEEKTKIALIEYGIVTAIVVMLSVVGILDNTQWSWIKPLIGSLISSVFLIQLGTNHIPTLIQKNKTSTEIRHSPQVETPAQEELTAKMGGFIDLATDVFTRAVKVVDSQLVRDIEEEVEKDLADPEIIVTDEVVSDAEEKIKDFLLNGNKKD